MATLVECYQCGYETRNGGGFCCGECIEEYEKAGNQYKIEEPFLCQGISSKQQQSAASNMSFTEQVKQLGFKAALLEERKADTIITSEVVRINGRDVTVWQPTRMNAATEIIDGHYWVEKDGKKNDQSKAVMAVTNSQKWMSCPDPHKFIHYEYLADSEMEQRVLTTELAKQKEQWGGEARWRKQIVAIDTQRTGRAFDCFTNSSHYHLVNGGVRRFGMVGIASPSTGWIHWIFGHPDNTKYEEWIVPLNENGKMEEAHTRPTPFHSTPTAVAEWMRLTAEEDKAKTAIKAKETALKVAMAAKAELDAAKAMDRLMMELDREDTKKKTNKKSKNNKKK
tara:strand:+ start:101 stop:1114 length:1014 start_codon:yes stop_codon:yes gene_type:complete